VLKLDLPAEAPEPQRDSVLALHRRYQLFVARLRPGLRSHFGFEAVFRYDLERALTAVTQPVLLPVLNEWLDEPTRQAAALIADSELVECPDFTKYVWDLEPGRMADLIRSFLDRPTRRAAPAPAALQLSAPRRAPSGNDFKNGSTQHWRGYVSNRYGQMHIRSATPTLPPGSTKAPVILLHPSPTSGNVFKELLQALGADRSVHALDMPGFGDSDWPSREPTIVDLARATAESLRELEYDATRGSRLDVFGAGMGAYVATELARQAPELIRRIILCGVPYYTAHMRLSAQGAPKRSYDFFRDPEYVDRLYKRIVEAGDIRLPFQRRLEHFTDHMLTGRNGEWADRATLGYDAANGLGAIGQPTLLMAFDDEFAEPTRAASSLVPKSKHVRLQGITAPGFISHPDRVAHAIREFLDS